MIQLNSHDFYRVIEPLKQVSINNLFARSVIEKKIAGKVFVDNIEDPETFYVVHPYGMSLLFGKSGNVDFNSKFLEYSLNITKIRNRHEWMQTYPHEWDTVLSELYSHHLIKSADNTPDMGTGIIELNTRVNFKFNREKYLATKFDTLPQNCEIIRADKKVYSEMTGSVIPSYFWNSADDFIKNGIGFSLFCNHKLATTAYSAFIHDDMLEIGIETIPDFRGKGFARLACSALIDFCMANNYEPVWSCKLENTASFKLAEKLGFEVYKMAPYYRLSK